MNKQTQNEESLYTVRRTYEGTCSINELIYSIIKSHYYKQFNDNSDKSNTERLTPRRL